jgi:hypothetical protein
MRLAAVRRIVPTRSSCRRIVLNPAIIAGVTDISDILGGKNSVRKSRAIDVDGALGPPVGQSFKIDIEPIFRTPSKMTPWRIPPETFPITSVIRVGEKAKPWYMN